MVPVPLGAMSKMSRPDSAGGENKERLAHVLSEHARPLERIAASYARSLQFVAHYPAYRAEPWRAFVGFGTAAAILLGVFVTNRRKRRKLEAERERFESLVAERTLS